MALFDSIISDASKKFGLGDKAGTILSALLALMTNQKTGGFSGFLGRFKEAGLGDTSTSWVTSGDNAEVSDEQIESAIGEDTITTIAEQVGVDKEKATSALAFMTPKVVDTLTLEGEIPDNETLTSKIGDFLTGIGGKATAAAAGIGGMAGSLSSSSSDKGDDGEGFISGAADKISDTAGDAVDKGKEAVGDAVEAVGDVADAAKGKAGDAAGAVGDKVGDAFGSVGDVFDGDGDDGNILKWLLPLILLAILMALGFMFCSGDKAAAPTTNTNTETNANTEGNKAEAVDSSVSMVAKDGKYSITGVVKDEDTKNKILKEAEATFGEGNVDVSGLKVDANAKPLADGWFDGFKALLPDLKGWKDGTISWAGDKINTVGEIPGAVADKLKSLFGGWTIAGSGDGEAKGEERKLAEVSLPDGTKLQAYPGGIEDQLIKFIGSDEYKTATDEQLKDKWFDFDDLNFVLGKTELVAESKRQLDNVIAILNAFPDVKIKIGGYTDKTGNDAANKTLSDNRAKAVKAALEKAGVGSQVPEAEGYGEEFAKIDEGASDEERAADRKTAIRLIKGEAKPATDANKEAKPAADADKKE